MLEQVSDEEEVQEIEESTSDDEEQDYCVLHGIDDEGEIEREARQLRQLRRQKCFVQVVPPFCCGAFLRETWTVS